MKTKTNEAPRNANAFGSKTNAIQTNPERLITKSSDYKKSQK